MAKKEATVSENTIMADVKAGKVAPIYLLTGEENYYIDILSDFFEENIVEPDFRDFDQNVLYGRDTDMRTVIGYAKQFPMMSERKLVLVKEAQNIDIREWDLLASYLENPAERSVLVLCYRNKKLDKRTKVYTAIKKAGVCFERGKLYDSDIPTWIADYVGKNNRAITEKAAFLLFEAIGNDLSKLSNELQKLFILTREHETITDSEIERNVGINKDYNIFELQNAISRKDVVRCNKIVNYFSDNPKAGPIPMVVANLYPYFIKVMKYHQLDDKSQFKAAAALGVPPYFVKDYEAAARNYTLGKLAICIKYLYDADKKSKGIDNNGTITDGEILKELIFKILH